MIDQVENIFMMNCKFFTCFHLLIDNEYFQHVADIWFRIEDHTDIFCGRHAHNERLLPVLDLVQLADACRSGLPA